MKRWNEQNSLEMKSKMLHEIIDMIQNFQLSYFYELHDFDDFDYALTRFQDSIETTPKRKIILNMDYPDRFREHDSRHPWDYDRFNHPLE